MGEPPTGDVTRLLRDWGRGDRGALDQLVPLVHAELRRLSRRYLRRGFHPSLQTTALVNEAFVRLIDQDGIRWESRAHFFGIAARTMRNVLVDYARKAYADKRGQGARPLLFDEEAYSVNVEKGWEILALEGALTDFAAVDPELARIVELRFFGGLTVEETAEVMGTSPATIKRGFRTAGIWLRRALERR